MLDTSTQPLPTTLLPLSSAIMCKAQQSYLSYVTAAGSGTLPLNSTIQPCAGYMLAYNAATQNTSRITGYPITEPTLFDVSHCPIFKLVPVFVSNKDFVVLDFASLPKVDAVQHRGVIGSGGSKVDTPIIESSQKRSGSASTTTTLQKVDEVAKSYSCTGTAVNTPTAEGFQRRHTSASTSNKSTSNTNHPAVDAAQKAIYKSKSTAIENSANSILDKTKSKPIMKEIEILTSKNQREEWSERPTTLLGAVSPLTTTHGRIINTPIVSPMASKTLKKIMYSPRTLRSIGRGIMSPGMGNVARSPGRIFTGVKTVKHEGINSTGSILEEVEEEDVEWQQRAVKRLEEADSVSKEV